MNKAEFETKIANKSGLSKRKAHMALDAILGTIKDTLAKGDNVQITGFGTFTTTQRAARNGINPATGARIEIKSTRVAKFKTGSRLNVAVKKGPITMIPVDEDNLGGSCG